MAEIVMSKVERYDALMARDIDMDRIGELPAGTGKDVYVRMRSGDGEPLSVNDACDFLLAKVYKDCSGPGRFFCVNVRGVQDPSSETEVICVAESRRDI
jgi:hypothetical protein